MKKKLFFTLAILILKVNFSYAANYLAAVSNASAKAYSADSTLYTVSGTIAFNPNGIPSDFMPNMCNKAGCRYGPGIVYKYIIRNPQPGGGFKDSTFYASTVRLDDHNSVPYGTDNRIAAIAYQNKFGNLINISDSLYGANEDKPPYRLLAGVGICMVAKLPSNYDPNARVDLNSCSFLKPTVSCTTPSELVLDHGNLQLGRVNGNKKTGVVNVNCTGALSAKLLLLPDTINLAPGLTSKVTVNGTSAETSIPLSSGANTLHVESTLIDSGAKAGRFEGSTTLVISYQ